MVKHDPPIVPTLREVVGEIDFATKRDVTTELVPTRKSHLDRAFESLGEFVVESRYK